MATTDGGTLPRQNEDVHREADGTSVVVGVDGSPEGTEALRHAVSTARARGLWLLVVHAYEMPTHAGTATPAVVAAEAWAAAYRVTADALSGLRIPAELDVQTWVERTPAVVMLRRLSDRAALVVLGQHATDPSDPVLAGPLSSALAASSSCPVVIVPARSGAGARVAQSVVVGLDARPGAATVLGFAFAEAERRHWPVTALYALRSGGPADQGSAAADRLAALLTDAREAHPGVVASTLVVEGDLAGLVLEASESARLLVVGRPVRHSQDDASPHSEFDAMLVLVRCPLVIVPPGEAGVTGGPHQS